MNKITRSTVNEQQYSAPQFPTSGFPQSYRRYMSNILGRIHVAGFHWTMPGDKISGRSSGQFTFRNIVTPVISPVNAMQYNIYIPFRPLDRSFKKGITPTKLNAMSANWSMPTVTTRYLVDQLLRAYFGYDYNDQITTGGIWNLMLAMTYAKNNSSATINDFISNEPSISTLNAFLYGSGTGLVNAPLYSLTDNSGKIAQMADVIYMRDALLDIAESITAKLGSSTNPLSGSMLLVDFINLYLTTLLEPFVGRYSYYAEFKYEYLRPFDFYRISRDLTFDTPYAQYADFLNLFSDTPQNEYPLRAMYAIWYERFRNVDLEPVSNTLPDWQDWSSTSIFDMSAGGNLCYLLLRIRSWEQDMFISAQIDDLSRHVYAPIYNASDEVVAGHVSKINNLDTNNVTDSPNVLNGGSNPSIYTLSYRNQLDDSMSFIQCPVPANVNDVLSALDTSFSEVFGLDLNTLRQSQMLEKYLKRNYLFGDEYQDRMLAHYNSRVSDMRINKPEILSQSLDGYDMQQEVSNVATSAGTNIGDRTATATIKVNGNEFSTYCEEFGIIVSIVCFMPRSMYDGTTPQLYMNKQVHLPLPEFATNNEEFGRKTEIAGSGLAPVTADSAEDNRYMFGRYPAYHAWRGRTDEVGGIFLDEMQDATFRRFFGMFSDDTTPKLNYFFIHCRPNLNMFRSNLAFDTQVYGDMVNDCYVERVLPTPVEVI